MSSPNGHINWESSYITEEWLRKAQVVRVDDERGREIVGQQNYSRARQYHGIEIPYFPPGETRATNSRLRRDDPEFETRPDGTRKEIAKYLSPPGWGWSGAAYFPPETNPEWLQDITVPVVIVEGEKKSIALRRFFYERAEDVLVIALPGVWNFRARSKVREDGFLVGVEISLIAHLDRMAWEGRAVRILFDSNAISNPSVFAARRELGSKLTERGANVRLVDLEPEAGVNGLDDYLGKHGPAKFAEFLEENPGRPARMAVEDAKAVVAGLEEALKTDAGAAGRERMVGALTVVYEEAVGDWMVVADTLRKAKKLADVKKVIKARIGDRPKKPKPSKADRDESNAKPVIDIGNILDLPTLTGLTWQSIKDGNTGPRLFQRAGMPLRLERDDFGRPMTTDLTVDRLRYEAARAADWEKTGMGAMPPIDVIRDALASPNIPLPILNRISEVPTFAEDGTLNTEPGYHAAGRVYYEPSPGLKCLPVSAKPSGEEVMAAIKIIDEMLADFPFTGEDRSVSPDRAHAFALFVLTFCRDMIKGATPMHLIEASVAGTGKGLLADMLTEPACGQARTSLTEIEFGEEFRKALFLSLYENKPIIRLDNVNKHLNSGAFASYLTDSHASGKVPYGRGNLTLPIRAIWIVTGNQVQMSEELARRAVARIRMVPDTDSPSERQGFKIPDIRAWLIENRAAVIWAGHTIVQNWIAGGMVPYTGKLIGSYEQWSKVIGGILEAAEIYGFLGNYAEYQRTANDEKDCWRELVRQWRFEYTEDLPTTKQLLHIAMRIDGFKIKGNDDQSRAISFGMQLGKRHDVICGDYRIVRQPLLNGERYWSLEHVEKKPEPEQTLF